MILNYALTAIEIPTEWVNAVITFIVSGGLIQGYRWFRKVTTVEGRKSLQRQDESDVVGSTDSLLDFWQKQNYRLQGQIKVLEQSVSLLQQELVKHDIPLPIPQDDDENTIQVLNQPTETLDMDD